MTNNDQWLYSIGSLSQPSSNGDVTKSHTFNSTALSYHFHQVTVLKVAFRAMETDNCCSNNVPLECYIFGFEIQYKAPSRAGNSILPYPRLS